MTMASTQSLRTSVTTPAAMRIEDQRVLELREEALEGARAGLLRDRVEPELLLPVLDGEEVEPLFGVGLEQVDDLLGRKCVPVLVGERLDRDHPRRCPLSCPRAGAGLCPRRALVARPHLTQ